MLGGGNPVGGQNPAGIGSSLNYIGKHAYLYTGGISVINNETNLAEFSTSGNSYVVGSWQPQIMENTGDDYHFKLYFNNQLVASTVTTSTKDYAPFEDIEIIVPTDTKVKFTAENLSSSSPVLVGVIMTGEVYA